MVYLSVSEEWSKQPQFRGVVDKAVGAVRMAVCFGGARVDRYYRND